MSLGYEIRRKIAQMNNISHILREINRVYYRRLYLQDYNKSGVDIFEEDWDTLIILDACRYDMFEEINTIPGTLTSRISRGSSTNEFMMGNLQHGRFYDTVYVTANPRLYRSRNEWLDVEFHDVINVWADDGWNKEYDTVLPETTTEYAIRTAEKYPHKRLIIHFIQPHYPFITDTNFDKDHLTNPETNQLNMWAQLMNGDLDLSRNKVWELYNNNLKRTLPSVHELINEIEGKSVVTSDHGNMVGERASPIPIREWGHPYGIHTEELVKVPWLINDGERKKIVTETPVEESSVERSNVEERLKSLGYYE